MFPKIPAGVKILIAGARAILKKLTDGREGEPPDLSVIDKYIAKELRRRGGGGGRGVVAEIVAQIFGVSTRMGSRAVAERGGNRKEGAKIRDPLAPGPYAITPNGAKSKYEWGHMKMVGAYLGIRENGETITSPLMALALAEDGEEAACAPMELGGPSD